MIFEIVCFRIYVLFYVYLWDGDYLRNNCYIFRKLYSDLVTIFFVMMFEGEIGCGIIDNYGYWNEYFQE